MGIWKLIETRDDVAALEALLDAPINAFQAVDLFKDILDDDCLRDHFIAAITIDKFSDVRSLVINRIDQLYFTTKSPSEICSPEVADSLRACIDDFKPESDDIFFKLQTLKDGPVAISAVMWVCDETHDDMALYSVTRDVPGLDYVVSTPSDGVYRVEAIDACVHKFHDDNIPLYQVAFKSPGL